VIASPPPPPASASVSIPATATVRPGMLTMTTTANTLTVTDATGSGNGWRITASASGGTADLTGYTAACATGSTCTLPVSSIDYPAQVTSATPLLQADHGTGLGTIRYSNLQWQVTPAGTAPVTISVTIQSGP
jgi:hypothetical protein